MKKIKFLMLSLLMIGTISASAQLYISSGTEFYIAPSEQVTSAEQVQNAGTLTIAAGATATLNGGATGAGVIKGTSTSNLVIGGTSTTGTYNFDVTINDKGQVKSVFVVDREGGSEEVQNLLKDAVLKLKMGFKTPKSKRYKINYKFKF